MSQEPLLPEILYHYTLEKNRDPIMEKGLRFSTCQPSGKGKDEIITYAYLLISALDELEIGETNEKLYSIVHAAILSVLSRAVRFGVPKGVDGTTDDCLSFSKLSPGELLEKEFSDDLFMYDVKKHPEKYSCFPLKTSEVKFEKKLYTYKTLKNSRNPQVCDSKVGAIFLKTEYCNFGGGKNDIKSFVKEHLQADNDAEMNRLSYMLRYLFYAVKDSHYSMEEVRIVHNLPLGYATLTEVDTCALEPNGLDSRKENEEESPRLFLKPELLLEPIEVKK